LAAYCLTPLPVRLLILASELDGRAWVRLSEDAELVEIPGGHFDWVTRRAGELAARLRSSPSGDLLLGSTETLPLAGGDKIETSSAGLSSAESLHPPARDKECRVLAPSASNKEIADTWLARRSMNFFRAVEMVPRFCTAMR